MAAAGSARSEAGSTVVALPGERLARAGGGLTEADLAAAEVFTLDNLEEPAVAATAEVGEPGDAGEDRGEGAGEPRRRRRRGGRGRGRGRGRAEEGQEVPEGPEGQEDVPAAAQPASGRRGPQAPVRPIHDEDEELPPARRAPQSTPFGSVWDSQLGAPVAPAAASLAPLPDDEEFDEPEIPEYLIAEQRRGGNRGGAGRGGPRGGRSAYQSAMERERYGRGGGGGGINRYPDVSARTRTPEPRRDDRGYGRGDRTSAPPQRSSNEPWSDVPPELEAMLRAQVAQKPIPRPAPSAARASETGPELADTTPPVKARAARKPAARTPRAAARVAAEPGAETVSIAAGSGATDAAGVPEAAPKRRVGRPPKSATTMTVADPPNAGATADVSPATPAKARAARKPAATRSTVKATTAKRSSASSDVPSADGVPAPKRRTTRKAATTEPA